MCIWEHMGCAVMWIAILYLVVRTRPLMSDTKPRYTIDEAGKADLAKGHFMQMVNNDNDQR